MATVPHPVPSRRTHNIAALYGHDDDTLVAWQRACVQAAEARRGQHDEDRLRKALTLAQDGHVEVADDGSAVVTSGQTPYHVQADGACHCPDFARRRVTGKHALAVQLHQHALDLLWVPEEPLAAPLPGAGPPKAWTPPPAPSPPSPPTARHSAAWDVHEAPVSSCVKIRVGAFEWTHTMRGADDAELHTRLRACVPTFREVVAALDALQAEREAAKAAPVPLPAAPATPAPAFPQADLPALLQQAVQQALAAANGQAPSTPQRPAKPKTGDQATGVCSLHTVGMEPHDNERGSWYSHWLPEDERHCKGRRSARTRAGRRPCPPPGEGAPMTLRIERYGTSRFWALYEGPDLVVVTVYKRGMCRETACGNVEIP